MRCTLAGLASLFALAAATPSLADPCDARETITALTGAERPMDRGPVLGRSAFSCGRYWSAANLMEKAAVSRSSSLQRFNLAATYARTGRLDEARSLYASVIADGDYIRARTDSVDVGPDVREAGVSLSEEAARRLTAMDRVQRLTGGPSTAGLAGLTAGPAMTGPLAAERAAVDALTLEGETGPAPADAAGVEALALRSGITDVEALRRDGLALPGG